MDRDRYEKAREELGLGEMSEDPAPEIDARRHDRDPEVDESDPDPELSLWLPAWITIPLLLTLPFALMGGLPTAVMEVLRYGEVLSISTGEVGRYILPFLLALGAAVYYYLRVLVAHLYHSQFG